MNSLERVRIALQRGQPDRVPIAEFLIDLKVAQAAVPGARDAAECMDRLDMDAVGCCPNWRTGPKATDGSYTDEWGVRYRLGAEALAHPIAGPVTTLADARAYQPPDPAAPWRLDPLRDLVRRYKGRRAVIFHHRAAFMWAAYLISLQGLLEAFLLTPDLADTLMDKVLECNMAVVRHAIHAGADVIVLGDDYADNRGPMMSPRVFDRFIQPRLARMIAMIHDEGALCIKHTDGNIYPILESIVAAEPDGINPIEPVAGMTLARTKALVGDRVCVVGNIDCGELLSHGTTDQVEAAVRQAIADAAPGGGYILTSSNSIHSSVRPENLVAMVRACQQYGVYA